MNDSEIIVKPTPPNHNPLMWVITVAIMIVASIIGGYYAGQGFPAQDIKDFGKARLNGEIYSCQADPKPFVPAPMSKEEAIEAAAEDMKQ